MSKFFSALGALLIGGGLVLAYFAITSGNSALLIGLGAGALALVVSGLPLVGVGRLGAQAERARKQLEAIGLRGTAKITAVRPTAVTINEDPVAVVDFEIHVNGTVHPIKGRRMVVQQVYLARLVPGGRLPVLVDPADPNRFVIEWQGDWAEQPA